MELRRAVLSGLRLLRRPPRWLILTLLSAAIVTTYVFIISAGRWDTWSTWNATYDLVAEGFRDGHLYLRLKPAPQLLTAPNPYDPVMRAYWVWDAIYYKGHLFYYWGPLPAVVLAGLKTILGWKFEVGDQYFVFTFYVLQLVACVLLIERMARRLFPAVPLWLVAVAVMVLAYAHQTPFIVATPGIYQAAIIGAQAFLLLGMVFATDAIWSTPARQPSRWVLLAAGVLWGCAIATRMSVAPAISLLILVVAFLVARPGSARSVWWQRLRAALWLGVPVAAFVGALLIYNRARFDSFLDFGKGKEMSTMQYRAGWMYFWPNMYSYFLRPMVKTCQFPFLTAESNLGALAFPKGFHSPPGYNIDEPVAGVLLAAPWNWFLALAGAFGVRGALRAWRTRPQATALDAGARSAIWFPACFAIIGTVTGVPMIAMFLSTQRYFIDVSAGLLLLATWGVFALYSEVSAQPWPRRLVTLVIVGVAVATIVIGLLLGVTGYNYMFRDHNPPLFNALVRAFSVCGR